VPARPGDCSSSFAIGAASARWIGAVFRSLDHRWSTTPRVDEN